MTISLLAPSPFAQFQCKSGNSYTATSEGLVAAVIGDVNDLENMGCVFVGAALQPKPVLIGTLKSANMNVTTDQAIALTIPAGVPCYLDNIRVRNASISLTTAAGGVYTATSKGGTAVVAAAQAYSALSSAALYTDLTIAAAGKALLSVSTLYLSLTTAQGAAATADFYVYGELVF